MTEIQLEKKNGVKNIVAAVTDHETDKYTLLESIIDQSRFFSILEKNRKKSGKSKKDFFVVIKPNISMMLRRADVGTYTDTFLVIHLLRLLIIKGYTHLAVVESQNLYGNWFENRSVIQVAAGAGYYDDSPETMDGRECRRDIHVKGGGADALVPLVDLSFDTAWHNFQDDRVMLGKTWMDADFRISFTSMKTHFYCYYTLSIKNIYGCLPLQDKVRGYHCKQKVGPWTAQLIRDYPVHFSIVDGYSAADGWMGVKMKAIFTKPHTLIAGADVMAVDHYGAFLMNLKADKSVMFRSLNKLLPLKPYKVSGNAKPFKYWRNPPPLLPFISRFLEIDANLMDYGGFIATGGNDACYIPKKDTKELVKRTLFFFSFPAAFFCDIGIVKLHLRQKHFMEKLKKKHPKKIPLILGSEVLLNTLTYLSPDDLQEVIGLLKNDLEGEITCSGHILFFNGSEVPFKSRLTTANLAVCEMLNHVRVEDIDRKKLIRELKTIQQKFPKFFTNSEPYAYCYR